MAIVAVEARWTGGESEGGCRAGSCQDTVGLASHRRLFLAGWYVVRGSRDVDGSGFSAKKDDGEGRVVPSRIVALVGRCVKGKKGVPADDGTGILAARFGSCFREIESQSPEQQRSEEGPGGGRGEDGTRKCCQVESWQGFGLAVADQDADGVNAELMLIASARRRNFLRRPCSGTSRADVAGRCHRSGECSRYSENESYIAPNYRMAQLDDPFYKYLHFQHSSAYRHVLLRGSGTEP